MKNRQRVEGIVYRNVTLNADSIVDEEERIVRISFSSELPVLRQSWFSDPWVEVLGHKAGEMNLERLNNGATLHYNHRRTRADRIGVVDSATGDGRGEATVRFSKNARVDDIWDDVKDNVLRNISVGYSIDERKLVKDRDIESGAPAEYRVTRWTPMELSFVDIPADPSVGLGRGEGGTVLAIRAPGMPEDGEYYRIVDIESKEEKRMDPKKDDTKRDDPLADDPKKVTDIADARKDGAAEGRTAEVERAKGIRLLFEDFRTQLGDEFEKTRDVCVDNTECSVDEARVILLKAIGKNTTSAGGDPVIEAGETEGDKFRTQCSEAVQVRAKLIKPEEAKNNEMRGYSLVEMARRACELDGINTIRMSRLDMVGRAFTTSDFPTILADASNKSMLKGFEEAPETWQVWAQKGSLSDFKIGRRVNLSSFDDLVLVNENGEFKYGIFTEEGETIQLATYGKLFSISRQAIINDDVSAFTMIPSRMGRAASRVIGDLAYGQITSNPTMGDGIALFNAAHNNLNESGAGGTPLTNDAAGVAALAAMDTAMALQSDVSGNATGLNILPAFLLVPRVLKRIATSLMSDTTAPGQANPGVKNSIEGLAEVVADPRLDADSSVRYYLAAGQQFDTIEVAFLDGVEAPMLEQQQGWTVDGTEYKVRIDVGVAPMSFRTWQRDDGA